MNYIYNSNKEIFKKPFGCAVEKEPITINLFSVFKSENLKATLIICDESGAEYCKYSLKNVLKPNFKTETENKNENSNENGNVNKKEYGNENLIQTQNKNKNTKNINPKTRNINSAKNLNFYGNCTPYNNCGSYSEYNEYNEYGEYNDYNIYGATFYLPQGLYFYYFECNENGNIFPLYKQNDFLSTQSRNLWQLSVIPKNFRAPSFFCGEIMYQIFPDRFYKEKIIKPKNKLKPYSVHKNELDTPKYKWDETESKEILNNDFFGGNLKGIIKKLPYIKSLGVKIIYLNPIFKAFSNHRYDTADYFKIDELLGTDKDFSALCKKAKKLNMYVILDGVFSHTGANSVYFNKYNAFKSLGAYQSKNSYFYDFYEFYDFPKSYKSWWGIDTLPTVNKNNPKFKNMIIFSKNSVIEHYLKLGAFGFRLDVADELPDSFIKDFRKKLKEKNKNALLIGEVWEDASNKISYGVRRKYFTGGELDGVMNYPFKNKIIDFILNKDNGEELKKTVDTLLENYPYPSLLCSSLALSTHDTPRILTVLSGKEIPESKEEQSKLKLSEEEFKKAKNNLFSAAVIQYMLPGITSIYYGDEIGTEGTFDPFNRSFFNWNKIYNNDILSFFKKMGEIKNKYTALKKGYTKIEVLKNNVIKITRFLNKEVIAGIINKSNDNYFVCNLNKNTTDFRPVFLYNSQYIKNTNCNKIETKNQETYNNFNDFKLNINPNGFAVIKILK